MSDSPEAQGEGQHSSFYESLVMMSTICNKNTFCHKVCKLHNRGSNLITLVHPHNCFLCIPGSIAALHKTVEYLSYNLRSTSELLSRLVFVIKFVSHF